MKRPHIEGEMAILTSHMYWLKSWFLIFVIYGWLCHAMLSLVFCSVFLEVHVPQCIGQGSYRLCYIVLHISLSSHSHLTYFSNTLFHFHGRWKHMYGALSGVFEVDAV